MIFRVQWFLFNTDVMPIKCRWERERDGGRERERARQKKGGGEGERKREDRVRF